ncbi:MAG: LapA family protein [Anaerolineae bacterium]|nr:LapA family protein [Anaerolineae bacterium]
MAILILILILALLAAVAAVLLALYNPNAITVTFVSWSFESSLAAIVLASFGIGALLGWLLTVPGSIKKSFSIAQSNKKIDQLEKQLATKTYNLPKVDDEAIQAAKENQP